MTEGPVRTTNKAVAKDGIMRGSIWIGWAVAVAASSVPVPSAADPAATKTIYLNNVNGSDGAGCGGVAVGACKTLQFAADQAASGDTLLMVNPGDYGPATITKSLTIQGIAGAGVFSPPNVACVTVAAGASDKIAISEFTCDQTTDQDGILFTSGASLALDRVTLDGNNHLNVGVDINTTTRADLFVRDSTIVSFSYGVGIRFSTTFVDGSLHNVTLEYNNVGVFANVDTQLMISDCVISQNKGDGLKSVGVGPSVPPRLLVSGTTIAMNGTGLSAEAGKGASGKGEIISFGGNSLAGNTIDGTFTSKQLPK